MSSRALGISRSACLAIISSAAEVYPKECMGGIFCKGNRIVAAFPYQLAKRKSEEVESDSALTFERLFKTGPYFKLGDYHSHPFVANEKLVPLGPSITDLTEISVGAIEVIVQIRRTRNKAVWWRETNAGSVSIAWDRYRFLIGAFKRLKGHDQDGVPLYKKVRLGLEKPK